MENSTDARDFLDNLVNSSKISKTNVSTVSTFESLYPLKLVVPFTIVYSVIFFTGVIGNISTCIVIARNKSMHTATNYYLFSLAISDMLLLVSGLPPEMYRIWSPDTYIFGEAFCFLQGFSAETSANATVLTITAFTVERYLAICHPFLSHTMSRLSRAIRFIFTIWIVALCLAIPQAIQFGIEYEKRDDGRINSHCTIVSKIFEHAFEISTLVFFVAPMTLITVLYVLIGVQLRKAKAKRPSLTSNNEFGRKKVIRNTVGQNRVVNMLIAVVAAFFLCWAPFHAQRLLAVYLAGAPPEAQDTHFKIYLYLMYTSGVLYFFSTTINPVLYHIMSHKYRKAFKKTFSINCTERREQHHLYHNANMKISKRSDFLDFATDQRGSSRANHPRNSGYSPHTTETSFSSSKAESCDSKISKKSIPDSKNEKTYGDFLKYKMLNLFKNSCADNLFDNTNTISNSSLKDVGEVDFICTELVKYMKEVNELL